MSTHRLFITTTSWSFVTSVLLLLALWPQNCTSASLRAATTTAQTDAANIAVEEDDLLRRRTPVVGVLSQPWRYDESYEYIASSYMKWLEAGGMRSVAIPYNASEEILDDIFTQIHAVLLPGGSSDFPETLNYLLDKIVRLNQESDDSFFPVWGTCMGFEFLVRYGSVRPNTILSNGFDAENVSMALEGVIQHELYADPDLHSLVTTQNITMNNHHLGVSPEDFGRDPLLSELWLVTSVNYDLQGRPFVSTIEPKQPSIFPFYGVQYHPEKNAFEYATYPNSDVPYEAIDHSGEAVWFSLKLASFFASLARKSVHANPQHQYTKTVEYPPIFSYPIRAGKAFEQIFLMQRESAVVSEL